MPLVFAISPVVLPRAARFGESPFDASFSLSPFLLFDLGSEDSVTAYSADYADDPEASIPRCRKMNAKMSASSSIIFDTGLPAPCPAFVSTRISAGAS